MQFMSLQLAGAGILGVGVWVKVDSSSLLGILGKIQDAPGGLNQLVNVGYLLIAVGGVLLVMGFLGCCGAVRESKCMLLLVSYPAFHAAPITMEHHCNICLTYQLLLEAQ